MKFKSTRGKCPDMGFADAVSEGLAPDGGLFVPETLPDISEKLDGWRALEYKELCFEFLKLFASDIPEQDLKKIAFSSYEKFDKPDVAPLSKLEDGLYLLELYHGPTLAFKDFALQFLGNLYEYLLSKSGRKINVLGATSGDTGSAAINGLLGKKNVETFILYPEGRISPLQERQMTCTGADNVFPIAIDGSFDDAQAIVKSLFGDAEFKGKYGLSAVNSINLARILAQCVYYIYAYTRLSPEEINGGVKFIVPTGNFGNVLAGWLAAQMGMKNASFRVATNKNDILYRLFNSGIYELSSAAKPSHAPSMDIQLASNFERFIYYSENQDTEKVCRIMDEFKKSGRWVFENFNAGIMSASRADDSDISEKILEVYNKYGVVIDPHTACGFKDISGSEKTKIVLSTAHPAKFPELIEKTLGMRPTHPSLEKLLEKRIVKKNMPSSVSEIQNYIIENAIR